MALDNYVHPHLSSTIIDNSESTSIVSATTETGTILFTPIISERGKTGVTQLFTDPLAFVKEYGEPNFKKYGQTMYNALRWLINGGQVRALRVLPDDAQAASISVHVVFNNGKFKTTVNGTTLGALFTVKCKGKGRYGNSYSISLSDNNSFGETYNFPVYNLTINKETALGTKPVEGPYLVALKPDAATKSGNPLFIKNVLEAYSPDFEVTFDEEAYYEITENVNTLMSGIVTEKRTAANTAATAVTNKLSAYNSAKSVYETALADVPTPAVSQPETEEITDSNAEGYAESHAEWEAYRTYLEKVNLAEAKKGLMDDAEGELIAARTAKNNADRELKAAESESAYEKADFIFGLDALNASIIDNSSADFLTPIALIGGTDGTAREDEDADPVDISSITLYKDKEALFTPLLCRAFCSGNAIDESILDKRNYPIDVLLDASFPTAVKVAMQMFKDMRGDCFAYTAVDPTHAGSFTDVQNWVAANTGDAADVVTRDYSTALFSQSFVCSDSYCGADINVDFGYILASMIPAHDKKYGVIAPMAGARRGVISGFKKISFNPNDEQQDQLYRNKVNYAIQTVGGTRINSNLTLQDKNSALSNINNVRFCYLVMRSVENMSDKYEFEFADSDVISAFQAELDSTLGMYKSSVSEISGTVFQSEYDKEQKIVRVRLEIVFKDIIERVIIEMNIGR